MRWLINFIDRHPEEIEADEVRQSEGAISFWRKTSLIAAFAAGTWQSIRLIEETEDAV